MDRNISEDVSYSIIVKSLSARRAWIEMYSISQVYANFSVALRKESVDRNMGVTVLGIQHRVSLSARRAWIEILKRMYHIT